jgi:hypothetical protein
MSEEGFAMAEGRDRQRLIFLIENDMMKGRFELLYRLYQREVMELSLLGAAKVISADLGIQVSIQTMRTLRNKCGEFNKVKDLRSAKVQRPDSADAHQDDDNNFQVGYQSIVKEMEGFKPIDVFSEGHRKTSSFIKWADKSNS